MNIGFNRSIFSRSCLGLILTICLSLFLAACQRSNPSAFVPSPTLPPSHTPPHTLTAAPQAITPSPTPTARPTRMLPYTPEPVDLSAPVILALSSRSCEHPIQVPPSKIYNPEDGPQAIIAGGRVQSGEFTFGAWLYCAEKQVATDRMPDPDQWNPYTNLRGLALYIEWMYEGPNPDEPVDCYHGFEPDIYPGRGWSAYCGQIGAMGMGFQPPKERLVQLTAAETPFRYVFKAALPDGQQHGINLSFLLRRVNDGFLVVNVETAPLTGAEQVAALPTLNPPPPAPPEATMIPQAELDQFEEAIIADLNARRFDNIRPVMSEEFDLQIVPLGQQTHGREEAAQALEYTTILPKQPKIAWRKPSFRFMRNYPGKAPSSIHLVETTGWGLSGQGQGFITISLEDGQLRWSGLLLYEDSYAPLHWLQTAQTPAGLIYQKDNLYFQVGADGNSTLLFGHESPVRFNPEGTAAVFGAAGQNEMVLYTFAPENKHAIPLDGYLMWGVDDASWLDGHTLLIALTDSNETTLSQGIFGHLALLDTISGRLDVLPIEVSIYAQPSTTSDGTILFNALDDDLMQWRDEKSQSFIQGQVTLEGKTIQTISSPVLSPDRTKLAGIATIKQGAENLNAYISIDLDQRVGHQLLTFQPIPFEGHIPQKIRWSPTSRWLAIQSQDNDPIQNGVWVISADGQERAFLGTDSSDPVWLDDQKVVFLYASEGLTRLQQYNVWTNERMWLNLPAGEWTNSRGFGLPSVSAVQMGEGEQ